MQGHSVFMEQAIALATENAATGAGGPFGAVIVRDDKVIATGVNCVTATNDPTAHAEMIAIRKACAELKSFSLKGCVIYASCEPCPMCLAAIYWARCDAIFYGGTAEDAADAGFDDVLLYREVGLPVERRSLPTINLLRDKAIASFDAWRSAANRIDY